MSLIAVRDIHKTYQGDVVTEALRGVTFAVEHDEFVAIMGPSGSGKSTLLHILGFLDVPSSGTYVFEEGEVTTYREEERARIRNERMGMVFQAFHLLPRTSVLENVLLPLQYSSVPHRERVPRARRAIAEVGLGHRSNHVPSQLSGGERQRVAIARALVNDPLVIFADEPTGNLDTATGHKILTLLDGLHKKGHTIILITHETPTARYAQRIIRLQDGLVVADDPVNDGHTHALEIP